MTIQSTPHLGWHSRGYLSHLDEPGRVQVIIYRLADSLPRRLVHSWAEDLQNLAPSMARTELSTRVADALDRGLGACWLRQSEIAEIVEQSLLHFDGQRYRLVAWCIMPNHVHAMIWPINGFSLDRIVQSWKSFSAVQCNKLLRRSGTFWARDYYDRFIRNDVHLERAVDYIENNPVKAGLVDSPENWPWSSARRRRAP